MAISKTRINLKEEEKTRQAVDMLEAEKMNEKFITLLAREGYKVEDFPSIDLIR